MSLVPHDAIGSLVALAESAPPGCLVEVGVYRGGTAWHLARIAREQGRALHLFDTFEGIPERHPEFDVEHKVGDFADASLDEVRTAVPDAVFHVGTFPDTMPGDLPPIAFVHVDCDQYGCCVEVIRRMLPLLVDDGIMLFDDYGKTSGVTKAVDEEMPRQFIRFTDQGKAYAVKGRTTADA